VLLRRAVAGKVQTEFVAGEVYAKDAAIVSASFLDLTGVVP
jgi:hypothetical protein